MNQTTASLGDLNSSERLISELYIDLRKRVNFWSEITHQTAQARMGYIGQHLTSVVTGYLGGKSGARGHDLILPNNQYSEIKTCSRVDQLGHCLNCDTRISSIERICPNCNSDKIERKDDSKWLIGIRNEDELAKILEPRSYYLVLFEFVDLQSPDQIQSSIWEINPKLPGFAYCMVDYYQNIRSNSRSRAPFNLWPYQLKFCLMRPMLIYQSIISTITDSIDTKIFPGRDQPRLHRLNPLPMYSRANNLTLRKVQILSELLKMDRDRVRQLPSKKRDALKAIELYIRERDIPLEVAADKISTALYYSDIYVSIPQLPEPLKSNILSLSPNG